MSRPASTPIAPSGEGGGATPAAGSLRSPGPKFGICGTENPPLRKQAGIPLPIPYQIIGTTFFYAQQIIGSTTYLAPAPAGQEEDKIMQSKRGRPTGSVIRGSRRSSGLTHSQRWTGAEWRQVLVKVFRQQSLAVHAANARPSALDVDHLNIRRR